MPLTQLIEDGFIQDTTIHIFNDLQHQNLIPALFTRTDVIHATYEQKTHKRCFTDIRKNFYIDLEILHHTEMLKKVKVKHTSKHAILNMIKSTPKLPLSCELDHMPTLPIWKKTSYYVEFTNSNDFSQKTGTHFSLDKPRLKELYVHGKAKKAHFMIRSLTPAFKEAFVRSYYLKHTFSTLQEYLLQILLDTPKQLTYYELPSKEHVQHLKTMIHNVLNAILHHTLRTAQYPTLSTKQTPFEQLLEQHTSQYYLKLKRYLERNMYLDALNNTIEMCNQHLFWIKQYKEPSLTHLYWSLHMIKTSLKFIKAFNSDLYEEFRLHFEEHYKDLKFITPHHAHAKQVTLLNDLHTLHELDKPCSIYIKNRFDQNLLAPKSTILSVEPPSRYINIPNRKLLRELYGEMYLDLVHTMLKHPEKKRLTVNGKIISIKPSFYMQHKHYTTHKKILENHYFIVFK